MDDKEILLELKALIASGSPAQSELHAASSRMLRLVESLRFSDDRWYDDITQHIVTIDSAGSFESNSSSENSQVKRAVHEAFDDIGKLVETKLIV